MIRKHKKFSKPRKAYDSARISEENKIVEKYGLKNKREIWKAKAKLGIIRNTAKKIINESSEEQDRFLEKLRKLGFNVKTTVDVLALTEEDIFKRRLQTVLIEKRIATTAKGARQLITHKHVVINGKIVDVPSYMVPAGEEGKIALKIKTKQPKVAKMETNEEVAE